MARAALVMMALVASPWDACSEPVFKGYSSYAAMHPSFPCDRFLTLSDNARNPAMSVLYRFFGTDARCVSAFTSRYQARARHHLVEYHLYYDPSRRSIGEAELIQLGSDITDIRAIAESVGNEYTHSVLSLGLEDRLDDTSAAKLLAVAKERWPYLIVRNPLKSRNAVGAHFRETHGRSRISPPCFANNDGKAMSKSGLRRFMKTHKSCYAVFLWDPAAQGYQRRNGRWKKPSTIERDYRISDESMRTYGELLR